jgi:hypothetical protein
MEMKAAITVAAIVANPLVITFKQSWKMKMTKEGNFYLEISAHDKRSFILSTVLNALR